MTSRDLRRKFKKYGVEVEYLGYGIYHTTKTRSWRFEFPYVSSYDNSIEVHIGYAWASLENLEDEIIRALEITSDLDSLIYEGDKTVNHVRFFAE